MTSGLANLCKGVSIPPMTVPFNLIDLLIFICLPTAMKNLASTDPAMHLTFASNNSSVEVLHNTSTVDWMMVDIYQMLCSAF